MTRLLIALILLLIVEALLGGTVVYLFRRRGSVEGRWTWLRSLGGFLLLLLIVTGVSLIPVIGRFAAVIAALVGVKRLTRLELFPAFLVSLALGFLVFLVALLIGGILQVELLALDGGRAP